MNKITITSRKGKRIDVNLTDLATMDYITEDYLRDGQDGQEQIVEVDDRDESRQRLMAFCASNPWECYSWDVNGQLLMIEDNDDGGEIYIDGDKVISITDDDGDEISVSDLRDEFAAHNIDWPDWEGVDYDYKAMAREYYNDDDNKDARYYVDDERGFANEWSLYVVKSDDADIDGDWRRITDEDMICSYIADAAMTAEDYRAYHLCDKACGGIVIQ